MPVWRLQTEWSNMTGLPRDRIVITPHFNDQGVGTDPDGLCADLAAALFAWGGNNGALRVTAYDAQGTPPVYPQGSASEVPGDIGTMSVPREVALCLSFYADRNEPRRRGRLYIPAGFLTNDADVRPTLAQMQKIGSLAPIFADLGGADVDWCVYSRADDTPRKVTNWWVDDEWDTIRSRGMLATNRITGTTSG